MEKLIEQWKKFYKKLINKFFKILIINNNNNKIKKKNNIKIIKLFFLINKFKNLLSQLININHS